MSNPMNHPNKFRIIIGASGILALGSVTALYALTRVSPELLNMDRLSLVLYLIAFGSIITGSSLSYVARVLPPPGPNPHRIKLYIGPAPVNPVVDIKITQSTEPATQFEAKQDDQTSFNFEVTYYSQSLVTEKNTASLLGPGSEIPYTAPVFSAGDPVPFEKGLHYPKKVVFKPKAGFRLMSAKLTIHDTLFIPGGEEGFNITLE